RVAEEDLGERAGDDGLEAGTLDRLRGVLAARAAAEVVAADDDAGAGALGGVERMPLRAAVLGEALVEEEGLAEVVEGHALEVARRDYAIGVDVLAGDQHGATGDLGDAVKGHQALT